MVNEEDKLTYDDLVEEHKIDSYKNLLDIINIDNDEDIRENFIFRGLKKTSYDLIPSALRYDDKTKEWDINKFIIESEFIYTITEEHEIEIDGEIKTGFSFNNINKSHTHIDANPKYDVSSKGFLHFRRESYVLLKFLDYSDKLGLKIPTSSYVRRRIHNHLSYLPKEKYRWPEPDFYEIISLAQHYGIPTRALDWSYDFKVALYFAVEDVLQNNTEDCVLWAFNYKLFEDNYNPHLKIINPTHEIDELVIYRPEYNNNSNLRSQKGLFTFLPVDINEANNVMSFDKIITDLLIERRYHYEYDKNIIYHIGGFREFSIKNDEKIFHKFIISGDLKAKILKELYNDGYAPENIYPGFNGVVESIEKHVKLDNILNKH